LNIPKWQNSQSDGGGRSTEEEEEGEEEGVIRSRKSKDRLYKNKKKKCKRIMIYKILHRKFQLHMGCVI
jgi:hypothetical protein